ncbi:hypothetical protein SAMD00019534_051770 [Acytostelium subglobosum LB1]|uniref:hypothetical protein n=1 Tax=Acytostelium subglobosum LB1 TaxID=1410327 RepID=UPI000644C402|nr:hypothetical protein SAMD00019534_051770 [Acytostelium subglobosum LB1]GAM22002.1 hypothetical protein SAMD00019534_051770 [Acytostelium subglobosum LB1]|eukprot:XP_012755102.1 hypothetical protein SAMD00019534_051770 [Acytostelium subglobosum LB1]
MDDMDSVGSNGLDENDLQNIDKYFSEVNINDSASSSSRSQQHHHQQHQHHQQQQRIAIINGTTQSSSLGNHHGHTHSHSHHQQHHHHHVGSLDSQPHLYIIPNYQPDYEHHKHGHAANGHEQDTPSTPQSSHPVNLFGDHSDNNNNGTITKPMAIPLATSPPSHPSNLLWFEPTLVNMVDNELDHSEQGLFKFPAIPQDNIYKIIDLSHNNIDTLPVNMASFAKLEQLILFNNQIEQLPSSVGALTCLTILDLSHNNLHTMCPEIGTLTHLRELYLCGNQLTEFPSTSRLKSLRKLQLDNNQLQEVPTSSLETLGQLQTLDLSLNKIHTIGDMSKLRSLKVFNLRNNNMTDLPPSIKSLVKLHSLSLDHNQFGHISEHALQELTRLAKLTISDNRLKCLPLSIRCLLSLIELNVAQNHLDALPDTLCHLASLKKLDISNNNIRRLPADIGQLSKLAELQLYNNLISSFPLSFLKCRSIRDVGVDGNPLPSMYHMGIKAIRHHIKNPHCDDIDYDNLHEADVESAAQIISSNPRRNIESEASMASNNPTHTNTNPNQTIIHPSNNNANNDDHTIENIQPMYRETPLIRSPPRTKYAWEIDFNELEMGELIGQGGFSRVYHGRWRQQEVAIKQIELQSYRSLDDFRKEVGILSKLKAHENLLRYYGACANAKYCYIITEFLPRGSLYDLLHKEGTRGLVRIDTPLILKFALGVALGCYNLSNYDPPIYHTDLKSKNLLITNDLHVKICDFGLASCKKKDNGMADAERLAYVYYAAPEILNSRPFTEKSDVFSFGTILWELITNVIPFNGMTPMEVKDFLKSGQRLAIPSECPEFLQRLITDCWKHNAEERPSFVDIYYRLKEQTIAPPPPPHT